MNRPYSIIHYHAPRFFINTNEEGKLGRVLFMFAKNVKNVEDAENFIDSDIKLLTKRIKDGEDTSIIVDIFEDNELLHRLQSRDLLDGKYYIESKPLIEGIWNLDKDSQTKIISENKNLLLASLVSFSTTPVVDISLIDIILEKFAVETEPKNYFFIPISSPYFVQNTEFR